MERLWVWIRTFLSQSRIRQNSLKKKKILHFMFTALLYIYIVYQLNTQSLVFLLMISSPTLLHLSILFVSEVYPSVEELNHQEESYLPCLWHHRYAFYVPKALDHSTMSPSTRVCFGYVLMTASPVPLMMQRSRCFLVCVCVCVSVSRCWSEEAVLLALLHVGSSLFEIKR